MRIGIVGLAAVGIAVLMLVGTSLGRSSGQEGQQDCTVTVEPGQSVQKVIDEAPEGAVICLTEGDWQEDLVIEKNLTLQGAGMNVTLVSGTGGEVTIQIAHGAKAAISDMQISHGRYGIKVGDRSQLVLARVRLTQNGDAGIEVWGPARVTIQESEISGNGYGISLLPSAQLVLSHSQVVRNLFGGIYATSARLTVTHSTISGNGPQAEGLRLMGESWATVEDSIFASNGLKALWIEDSSEVLVRNTRFEDNGSRDEPPWVTDDGISISGNAHVVFESVVVSGNGQNGVEITGQAHVSLKNSLFRSNQGSGLHLQGQVVLVLEDTAIAQNHSSGLDIWGAEQVTLIRTQISQNGYNGIYLQGAATVLLVESILRGHPRCGIEAGQNFIFGWGNRFADNKEEYLCDVDHQRLSRQLPPNPHSQPYVRVPEDVAGLQEAIDLVQDGGVIEVRPGVYNETLEIYELGVTLRGAGTQTQLHSEGLNTPTITIFSSSPKEVHLQGWSIGPGAGVLIGGGVRVTLLESRVFQHGNGLSITGDASVEIRDTVIEQNVSSPYGGGLVIQDSARLVVRNSKVVRNSNGLITQCRYGHVCAPAIVLLNTAIQNNGNDGLHISGNGTVLDIRHSAIQGNGNNGLSGDGGVQLTLIESMVSDNGGDGIYVWRHGPQLNLLGNRIYNNVGCGIRVFVGVEGQFHGGQNEIHNNGRRDLCSEEWGFQPSSAPDLSFLIAHPTLRPSSVEVCPQGCTFTSIAEAVAAVEHGGTVRVQAGSYGERIVIGKSVTLIGEGPDRVTVTVPIFVMREEPIQVSIEGFTVRKMLRLRVGLQLGGKGLIRLRNLKVLDSIGVGLSIQGSVQVHLDEVTISGSWADGLVVSGQATVEVSRSTIEGNGFPEAIIDWSCYDLIATCSGILVAEGAQLTVADSIIQGNMDWGVAAFKRRCGYDEDQFTGRVVFKGRNIIRDNNKSGNHKGQGNPGRHPWRWFWIPSGQVCLP